MCNNNHWTMGLKTAVLTALLGAIVMAGCGGETKEMQPLETGQNQAGAGHKEGDGHIHKPGDKH